MSARQDAEFREFMHARWPAMLRLAYGVTGDQGHAEDVAQAAFARAGVKPSDIDAVAVTAGPGLAGALMVGVGAAKAYALALDKPLYGVNHLAAHVAVDQLEHGPLPSPCGSPPRAGGPCPSAGRTR